MWRISPNSTKSENSWGSGGGVTELSGGSPPALQLNSCSPDGEAGETCNFSLKAWTFSEN